MIRGASDAAPANGDAGASWQDDVHPADLAQLVQHAAGLITQTRCPHYLEERFPEHVGQKADQDVGQHAVVALVPDGPNTQVAFFDAKGGLCLGELDVGVPEIFGCPVCDVAP